MADKMNKVMESIGLHRKLQSILPGWSVLARHKSFIRPHLNYGDVISDQLSDKSCLSRIAPITYNAVLHSNTFKTFSCRTECLKNSIYLWF